MKTQNFGIFFITRFTHVWNVKRDLNITEIRRLYIMLWIEHGSHVLRHVLSHQATTQPQKLPLLLLFHPLHHSFHLFLLLFVCQQNHCWDSMPVPLYHSQWSLFDRWWNTGGETGRREREHSSTALLFMKCSLALMDHNAWTQVLMYMHALLNAFYHLVPRITS